MEIIDKTEWSKLAIPISDKSQPPFNWYSFKHSFGSGLVENIFKQFGISKGDLILDPFCGSGTTLIKAKLEGINSIGLDISPFSVFLSNLLTTKFNINKVRSALQNINHNIDMNVEIPAVPLLKKSFSDKTLKYIYSLYNSINRNLSAEKEFLTFALLCILNDVSKAKKSGGFLRITNQRKTPPNIVKQKFIHTVNRFLGDVNNIDFKDSKAKAYLCDARKYPKFITRHKFDAILTSPPYPNRHDYTRIYELELLVGFIKNNDSLKSLRYKTLRSHVEATIRYKPTNYIIPTLLERKIKALQKRELNNRKVVPTLYGYFEDMYLCLNQMKQVIKKDKYIGVVVSNVRYSGVMIPVDEILANIGEQIGLATEYIYILRYRGNSSQQMSKYSKKPTRESLIIWKN